MAGLTIPVPDEIHKEIMRKAKKNKLKTAEIGRALFELWLKEDIEVIDQEPIAYRNNLTPAA